MVCLRMDTHAQSDAAKTLQDVPANTTVRPNDEQQALGVV